jgi:hypothetical protein
LVEGGPLGGDGGVSRGNSGPPGSRKASKDGSKVDAGIQDKQVTVEVCLTDVS